MSYVVNLEKDDLYRAVLKMKLTADSSEDYDRRCIMGEKVYFVYGDHAVMPGHIYSAMGMAEYQRISGVCEYHFDRMFPDEDDE